MEFKHTRHSRERQVQRGITDAMIQLVLNKGVQTAVGEHTLYLEDGELCVKWANSFNRILIKTVFAKGDLVAQLVSKRVDAH